MVKIVCRKSANTGKIYTCLEINGVLVFVDTLTLLKISNLSFDYLSAMTEGDEFTI